MRAIDIAITIDRIYHLIYRFQAWRERQGRGVEKVFSSLAGYRMVSRPQIFEKIHENGNDRK
jgi:hypothetical protein